MIFGQRLAVVLVSALTLSGCAHYRQNFKKTYLTAQGAEVTLSSDSPAADCKHLGLVSYSFFKGTFYRCDFVDAQNVMRNQAAELGGNYVKLFGINDAGVRCQGSGEAYQCPAQNK